MASSTIVGLNAVLQLDSCETILQSWGNKTVQNATEQRNIIAASLRKGRGSSAVWENPHRPFTASGPKWFDRRAWLNGTHPNAFGNKTWFWLKIQSTWKLYDIRQQAYNNVIVHILCSMCSAQVHMLTQHWENIRHHVVHVEKWEHLQF